MANREDTSVSDLPGGLGSETDAGAGGELERARRRIEELEFQRDGYYSEWQHAKNQLDDIHASRFFQVWMTTIQLRSPDRRPVDLLKLLLKIFIRGVLTILWLPILLIWRFVTAVGSAIFNVAARVFGWIYLQLWTIGARAMARLRPQRTPEPPAAAVDPADRSRLRLLLVSPYHIYPADHGGGVRLLNLVRELSARCDLYLLVFSQEGEDSDQREELERWCARVDFHHWRPQLDPDTLGLVPPNAQLFASDRAAAKIRDIVLGHDIDVVQLEYTELGQYHSAVPDGVPVVLTEHDIAFRSFRRRRALGFHHRFPEGGAFGTTGADARRLTRYEILSCRAVDQIQTMSVDDADYLSRFLSDGAERLVVAPNGVSTEFYREPDPGPSRTDVLYVGNYQNLPNVDALEYFVLDVWPLLRLKCPDSKLSVVGANPSERVTRFDGSDGITVVGPVDDLREAYHGHRVMVAPIRAGSGTRLKILEAFAAGIPVVSTTLAAEGIAAEDERHLLIADNAVDFADAVARVLADDDLAKSLPAAAAELVRDTYDWRLVAETMIGAYRQLPVPARDKPDQKPSPPVEEHDRSAALMSAESEVAVVIPTLDGGEDLERCLMAINEQRTDRRYRVLCIDSGSRDSDLQTMDALGAAIFPIDRSSFNHGLTRDLGAQLTNGRTVVYLNQDAVPAGDEWLENLVSPFDDDPKLAAVQGGMAEVPDLDQRFYWDSCGARFYFTSESEGWITRFGGIGFSTVNCAIRRSVLERYPFGWAAIMEDKKWQREVVEAGHTIVMAPDALVHHTHNYRMKSLLRRCNSEGYGWRTLGERYDASDMLADMVNGANLRELARGLKSRRIKSSAELFFPWLRPMALYWGNNLSRDVKL